MSDSKETRAIVILYNGTELQENTRQTIVRKLVSYHEADPNSIDILTLDSCNIAESILKNNKIIVTEELNTSDKYIEAAAKYMLNIFGKEINGKEYTTFAINLAIALSKTKKNLENSDNKRLLSSCDILSMHGANNKICASYGITNKIIAIIKDCIYAYSIN